MNYERAMEAVLASDRGRCSIRFVTPVLSVCLAARCGRDPPCQCIFDFQDESESYARNNGLHDAVHGSWSPRAAAGLAGQTYTPLARITTPAHVDPSNALINGLFRRQLPPLLAAKISKVVGELHDNIASHARGFGFSAAQVYRGSRLAFAIADAGCGLLANARRVGAALTDAEALVWAFGRGNTSARSNPDPWGQRWSPGAGDAQADWGEEENAHQGLGLASLEGLVTQVRGSLWVVSGSAQRVMENGTWVGGCTVPAVLWPGVAIEVDLPVETGQRPEEPYNKRADELAKELGL